MKFQIMTEILFILLSKRKVSKSGVVELLVERKHRFDRARIFFARHKPFGKLVSVGNVDSAGRAPCNVDRDSRNGHFVDITALSNIHG